MKTKRMLHHNNNVFKRKDRLNSQKFETITNIIREYYKNSNEEKDCPVCYEIIKPDNLRYIKVAVITCYVKHKSYEM